MIARDFNVPLLVIDKNSWKGYRRFEHHTIKLAVMDKLGNPLPVIRKSTLFWSIRGTCAKFDHVVAHNEVSTNTMI